MAFLPGSSHSQTGAAATFISFVYQILSSLDLSNILLCWLHLEVQGTSLIADSGAPLRGGGHRSNNNQIYIAPNFRGLFRGRKNGRTPA
jgi:hypothetical protein